MQNLQEMCYNLIMRRDKKRLDYRFTMLRKFYISAWMIFILVGCLGLSCCSKGHKTQVILISIDTLRGDHITPYGYYRNTTPNLQALVKDSLYFKNGYTNGCWTIPSHMSLLTGTLPSRHGVNRDISIFTRKKSTTPPETIKLISEILKAGVPGIKTAKFANLPSKLGFARGFEFNRNIDPFADDIQFEKLINQLRSYNNLDFFLFIHTWMVHAPYSNSQFLQVKDLTQEKKWIIDNFRQLSNQEKENILGRKPKNQHKDFIIILKRFGLFDSNSCQDLYDGGIKYVDQYIGRLINELKKLGIYENTMIIITSDHGEHFSERNKKIFYDFHGRKFFEEFIKVPIILKVPQQKKHGIITKPISLIDIFPSILSYFKIPIPKYAQGESLLTNHSKKQVKHIVSEAVADPKIEKKMIREGDFKLIITMKNPGGWGRMNWNQACYRKLFNLKTDPEEKHNLWRNLEFRNIALKLEKTLRNLLKDSITISGERKETEVDQETIKHMKSLGYI